MSGLDVILVEFLWLFVSDFAILSISGAASNENFVTSFRPSDAIW